MHKSMDLGYYLPDTSIKCYPSLMSPLSSFDKFRSPNRSKGIFDRLQADTELRLRARLNSVSQCKVVRAKVGVPIEEKLMRKGKEKEVRLRHLMELEESKRIGLMQDRPYVSPNSKALMRNKTSSTGRLLRNSRDSREAQQPENGTSRKPSFQKEPLNDHLNPSASQVQGLKNSEDPEKTVQPTLKTYQKQLIKQLAISYKLLTDKKNKKPKPGPLEVRCIDRKYVPMFDKQSDWLQYIPKNASFQSSATLSKTSQNLINKKSSLRPSSIIIADSSIGFEEALTYQQIIRNRIMNSSSATMSSTKRIYNNY